SQDQQFQAVVKHGGITAGGVDDRKDFFDVFSKQIRFEHGLPGMHPIDVAAKSIDFPIMGYVAIRMPPFPAWKSIGAEPGMNERKRAFQSWMREVRIVFLDLLAHEHA